MHLVEEEGAGYSTTVLADAPKTAEGEAGHLGRGTRLMATRAFFGPALAWPTSEPPTPTSVAKACNAVTMSLVV